MQLQNIWGYNSVGRVSRSQRGSREFESHYLHHTVPSRTHKGLIGYFVYKHAWGVFFCLIEQIAVSCFSIFARVMSYPLVLKPSARKTAILLITCIKPVHIEIPFCNSKQFMLVFYAFLCNKKSTAQVSFGVHTNSCRFIKTYYIFLITTKYLVVAMALYPQGNKKSRASVSGFSGLVLSE